MSKNPFKTAIERENIEWQRHSVERILERNISTRCVKEVLLTGEILESYADDKPFPSYLILGWCEGYPLHVVAAIDTNKELCFIITAYRPDIEHFKSDFKTRRHHHEK
jgi:hypothetical protein